MVDENGSEVEIFDDMEPREEETIELQIAGVVDAAEFSLNLVMGFSSSGTLKMKGIIENREVIVFIDCRATHNFIAHRVVDELELPLIETTHFRVIMGMGKGAAVRGKRICRGWC